MKFLKLDSNDLSKGGSRVDASFHLSTGSIVRKVLESCPYEIENLSYCSTKIFSGNIFRRTYVESEFNGFRYLTASDMMKGNANTGKFISKKFTTQKDKLEIKKEWILVSCSGTLGNIIFTNETYDGVIATHDLIRVIPDVKRVKSGYLFAYLKSSFGKGLLTEGSYGGVVKHIEPHHIAGLPVPIISSIRQEEIHSLVIEAKNEDEKSTDLLNSVNRCIEDNLIQDFDEYRELKSSREASTGNRFVVSLASLNTKTLRARNYGERKSRIISILTRKKWDRLGDVLERPPFYGSRYKRIASSGKNGIELFSQGDLFNRKPCGRLISKKSIKNLDHEMVKSGTILVPAQGTLGENEIFGRAKFTWGYLENKLIAGHVMRFVADQSKIPPGYLFAVLSSQLWFRIFRSTVYGTNLLGFITDLLVDYPIPRLTSSLELEIDSKVKEAYECSTQSIKLENEAINLIEKEIESWQN